jgi:uncharacterized protein YjbI with pentapeptide repeats
VLAEYDGDEELEKPEPGTFAAKATDLQALRDAVVDAAGVGTGLWLSYLFVLFYFAVAAGAVTHRDLLLENPVKLPFLNVELPLKAFFTLGPLVFLVVHAYVLLHFVLLAGKIGAFHKELQDQVRGQARRGQLRRQLPSNIFVQSLAGPRDVREGPVGFLLWLIVGISLVASPIALLVLFQLQFLPYHNAWITWWQRIAVAIDLAFLWFLWPPIARGDTSRLGWNDFKRPKILVWFLVSALPVAMVVTIATFPGEWLDEKLYGSISVDVDPKANHDNEWLLPRRLLVSGRVDYVSGRSDSLFSNVLVLPNFGTVDASKMLPDGKTSASSDSVSLRGRSLEGAVFVGAHLTRADFTAAQLVNADFTRADLREAKFACDQGRGEECTQLQSARFNGAQLQGAFLDGANLELAQLSGAQLQGASLDRANLRNAQLISAHLQGASLENTALHSARLGGAQLDGAWLNNAHLEGVLGLAVDAGVSLQGASLDGAFLQGASLAGAEMQSASLKFAHLQAANMYCVHLENASLYYAEMQAASLDEAQLQKASLDGAQLLGVSFRSAKIQGASIDGAFVWRAEPPESENASGAFVHSPNPDPKLGNVASHVLQNWSESSYNALKSMINSQVQNYSLRDDALKRIQVLEKPPYVRNDAWAKGWSDLANSSPSSPNLDAQALVKKLIEVGCEIKGAPYVVNGLIKHLSQRVPFQDSAVATAFLDSEHCAGAKGLSEEAKARLLEEVHPPAASLVGKTP